MFLYKNPFFSISSILSIPIMLIGINGGYFPAICRVCLRIRFWVNQPYSIQNCPCWSCQLDVDDPYILSDVLLAERWAQRIILRGSMLSFRKISEVLKKCIFLNNISNFLGESVKICLSTAVDSRALWHICDKEGVSNACNVAALVLRNSNQSHLTSLLEPYI